MSNKYLKIYLEKEKNSHNCVFYAREKVPNLPFGLWTLQDKKNIINSRKPEEGSVAIIETRQKWGHVAVVKYVGKRHITIKEANWEAGKITERHGLEKDFNILGYFKP